MATNLTPTGGLQPGDVARLTVAFTTAAGEPATVDVADVTVRVRVANARTTTGVADLTPQGEGAVSFPWVCAAPGKHEVYAAWNDGSAGAAVSAYFTVDRDPTA